MARLTRDKESVCECMADCDIECILEFAGFYIFTALTKDMPDRIRSPILQAQVLIDDTREDILRRKRIKVISRSGGGTDCGLMNWSKF